jgi:wyosine [tRNA(Phe)-imidazoG37] synthetase (radical SAM superfamily)
VAFSDPVQKLFQSHARSFDENRYVYPVLSRRAGGLSIGINLNPDKICNFDCIYCQVQRVGTLVKQAVDVEQLRGELANMLDLVTSGRIFEIGRFRDTPQPLRRLNDIALSGDGEPTTCPVLVEALEVCAELRRQRGLDDLKLVLITNATMFDRPRVARALEILDANHGEIWAKLDAGTEAYYRQVDRAGVPLERILRNLVEAAQKRPIVIQSLFMRIRGQGPSESEQQAYCDRLAEILAAGGQLSLIQIHTVARRPAESYVAALSNDEVDAIADRVRQRTGLPVATYYGS